MRHLLPGAAVLLLLACAGSAAAAPPPPKAPTALEALNSSAGTVTIDVQAVPLEDVLRVLSRQFGLSIITAKNVNTSVTARFKSVTLKEALDSLVTINGFAYRAHGRVIEVYDPREGAGAAAGQAAVETFTLQYASALELKELLRPFLSKDSGKIEAELNGNTLIVCDTPAAIATIAKVIERVDRPEPQITIGAEIIEVSDSSGLRLGIDWSTKLSAKGSARPTTFPFSNSSTGGSFIPSNPSESSTTDDTDTTTSDFTDGSAFPNTAATDFTFGMLDATGLSAVFEAIKTKDGVNVIANPEITTLNNREAKINIGDTVPVPIYTTNIETGVTAVTGFQEVDTGTILTVIPRVNRAGESVTLRVRPEISEITGYKGQFDERPVVSSRRAETTVRLQNGETLVIGGLVRQRVERITHKIPLLGDIPIAGWLFKSIHDEKTRSTLYIFITPRINMNAVERAKAAGDRLFRDGLEEAPDDGCNELRGPGTSPFED